MVESPHAPALAQFLRVLRRGIWTVVLATVVTTVTVVTISLRQPDLYEGSADVLLRPQNVAASLGDITQPNDDPERVVATQARVARLPAVAEAALKAAGKDGGRADDLLDASSVSAAADFLTFSVRDRDPNTAVKLATAYARAYTEYRRSLDTESLIQARRELENEMRALRARGEERSALYAALAAKDQQLRTNELLQTSNASLVRPADTAKKVQPRPLRDGVVALVLGLVLGVALAFSADALTARVRTVDEIQERLGLPLLARIPDAAQRRRGREQLAMLASPHGADAEAFRILATNLDFVSADHPVTKVLVTSALPGEGKTATIANLGVAFARIGRRVVLVDLDLRSPSIDRLFGLAPGQPGVTDVATGRMTLDAALVRVPIPNSEEDSELATNGAGHGTLEVLPSGRLAANPAEFIASATSIANLLDRLAVRAHLVLVDAPPILEASDAVTLSAKVDAMLVVARLGETSRAVMSELRRVLDGAPARKLGFVAMGVKDEEDYGRAYAYGFRHTEERGRSRERERLR